MLVLTINSLDYKICVWHHTVYPHCISTQLPVPLPPKHVTLHGLISWIFTGVFCIAESVRGMCKTVDQIEQEILAMKHAMKHAHNVSFPEARERLLQKSNISYATVATKISKTSSSSATQTQLSVKRCLSFFITPWGSTKVKNTKDYNVGQCPTWKLRDGRPAIGRALQVHNRNKK